MPIESPRQLPALERLRDERMQLKRTVVAELGASSLSALTKNIVTGVVTEAWTAQGKDTLVSLLGRVDGVYRSSKATRTLVDSARVQLPELFDPNKPSKEDFSTLKCHVIRAALERSLTGSDEKTEAMQKAEKLMTGFMKQEETSHTA